MAFDLAMRPLVVAYGSRMNESTTFTTLEKELTIDEFGLEIEAILKWCNGHRLISEVRDLSEVETTAFDLITSTLIENNILVDARSLGQVFHGVSMHPLLSTHDLSIEQIAGLASSSQTVHRRGKRQALSAPGKSEVLRVLSDRKSSRTFGEEALSDEQLSGLLKAMYGITCLNSAVPSAGGLYTLRIYVILLKRTEGVAEGVYEYTREDHALRKLGVNLLSEEMSNFLLDSEGIATGSSAIVCVGMDLETAEKKYANRAYRFLLLESGHVAQNAYLFCAEANLHIVEYGGFNDIELARYLGLRFPRQGVLTTLVVGTSTDKTTRVLDEYGRAEWKLRHDLMDGKDREVTLLTFDTHRYRNYVMPRYIAHTEYVSPDPDIPASYEKYHGATGSGVNLGEAAVKALGEAFERRASGLVRFDLKCSRNQLKLPVYDLCFQAPLHPDYVSRFKFSETEDQQRYWVRGTRLSDGSDIVAPIDQVFYPVLRKHLDGKLGYPGSSTGVAAHPDRERAIDSALLELVERDAIAVTWYAKRSVPSISEQYWPYEIRARAKALGTSLKRLTRFCDLSLDSVPVVMCILTSDLYPHLVTGSAAHWDYNIAMSKAQDEAEIALHAYRDHPKNKRDIEPQDVMDVTDHSTLWATKKWSEDMAWLWSGSEEIVPSRTAALCRADLIQKFDPAVIDLVPNNLYGLNVVRVVSNILMPITFGYGAEHYRHPRVTMLGFQWSWPYPATPHCLA